MSRQGRRPEASYCSVFSPRKCRSAAKILHLQDTNLFFSFYFSHCVRVCASVFVGVMLTEAEELYQKRVLTITGICVALLVVGIVCVVAYCKTK